MRRFFTILLLIFPFIVRGQESIGGNSLNSYYKVSAVGANSVTCAGEDVSDLSQGDKVLLVQMTGSDFIKPHPDYPTDDWEIHDGFVDVASGNSGEYEFLSVIDVNDGTKVVSFTQNLNNSYDASESIQLVKVYEATSAIVTSDISVPDWDGNKGGILAMVIFRKLTLEADINLQGKGFRGATPNNYLIDCRPSIAFDTMYFVSSATNRGGNKGEGVITLSSNHTIGPGNNATGGGGGIGKFGGGGGGSNYRRGGEGGQQVTYCNSSATQHASGGFDIGLKGYYKGYERITFGGGGGSSSDSITLTATAGGDGGGMIFILTDTLDANSHTINVNGESVTGVASSGAGGGGAAGTILLDVSTYINALNLVAEGGDGGDTDAHCGGAGGGGSGGLFWHSGSSVPGFVSFDSIGGASGTPGCASTSEGIGLAGDTLNNLKPVINGFTFNAITGIDIICEGQAPDKIVGTMPKGATNYSYQWLKSADNVNWSVLSNDTLKDYQPGPLTTTTYYTREVTFPDAGPIIDTAFSVEILVYSLISDNELTLRDTVCTNIAPGALTAKSVSGGDGTYRYSWESSINQILWTPRGNSTTEFLDETNNLTLTTYYRRIVESGGVCVDSSNVDTISVLPLITNNIIINPFIDTAICFGSEAGVIIGGNPGGGDGTYRYSWLESADNFTYSDIPSETEINFDPGTLNSSTYYKRIVYSGEGNACIDTMLVPRSVEVLDTITDNIILGADIQYTCYNSGKLLNGSQPKGGTGSYDYIWLSSDDGNSWADAGGSNQNFTTDPLTSESYFRRVVHSGENAQCKDTSMFVLIYINPLPTGDILSGIDTLCAGDEISIEYNSLTGSSPWIIELGESSVLHTESDISTTNGTITFVISASASVRALTIQDDSLCFADTSLNTGVVDATVYEIPVANAGEDFDVCGLSTLLNATLSTEGVGLWESYEGSFDDATSPTATVEMRSYGVKSISWTETNWQCTDQAFVEVTHYEQPLTVNAGEDQELPYHIFEAQLDADNPDIGEGVWKITSGDGEFEDSTLFNTLVTVFGVGNFSLQWTISNGVCIPIADNMVITRKERVKYNGFSPNGDGVNDEYIFDFPRGSAFEVIITDRYGNLVFRESGDGDGVSRIVWDGKNEGGQSLPEDTYFYFIKEEGVTDIQKFIDIRR